MLSSPVASQRPTHEIGGRTPDEPPLRVGDGDEPLEVWPDTDRPVEINSEGVGAPDMTLAVNTPESKASQTDSSRAIPAASDGTGNPVEGATADGNGSGATTRARHALYEEEPPITPAPVGPDSYEPPLISLVAPEPEPVVDEEEVPRNAAER